MATKTERVEARLSTSERDRIERAARHQGRSVSSFMVDAAVERADAVLAEHTVTAVPADYFDNLVAALDTPDPAARLARTAQKTTRRARLA